jgi:VWFA-related protein
MRRFVEILAVALAVQTTVQPPTFKSSTEAVWMSATVTGPDGHLMTDLRNADFEVREDGVAQEVTTFRSDRIPFALVSMFDLSGSMVDNLPTMQRAMRELVGRFEPGDRARIGTFDTIGYLTPEFSGNSETLLKSVSATLGGSPMPCALPRYGPGLTALWDAVGCGIDAAASDAETPRRVVLVISDGNDNVSQTTVDDVIGMANDYGVMVYTILMNGAAGADHGGMKSLAAQTGGGFFFLSSRDDLPAAVAQVSEELRHQYVFGISIAADDKKHRFDVKALRPGSTTRAHRVYMTTNPVQAPPEATTPSVRAAAPAPLVLPSVEIDVPSAIDVVPALDRFDRGDWSAATSRPMTPDELQAFAKALRQRGPAWIEGGAAENQRRRRLSVATFVLQVLSAQEDPFVWIGGGHVFSYQAPLPAAAMIEWTAEMLKHDPPLPAERWWHLGAIALLERAKATEMLNLEVDRARGRFPAEDRWALARAISEEFRTWPEPRDDRPFSPPPVLTTQITARYQDALLRVSVRAEAELRLGYFELRRGRIVEAQRHFDKVGRPAEATLRYWLGLFQGQAFEETKQWPAAIDAYRNAFNAAPYAQSAAFALAGALVQAHRVDEAAGVASRTLAVRPVPFDPWAIYTVPDIRFWPRITAELRAAVAVKQ